MTTSREFMATAGDFYDVKSRFFCQSEIFMMTGGGFHDDRSRFSW